MEKNVTLNLKINPTLKHNAESVLEKFDIPMSTTVEMFLNQVILVGGIPFSVTIPNTPESIDGTRMTREELRAKIQRGYDDYKAGNVQNAADAFARFKESHNR